LESIAETQPQLRFAEILSDYFPVLLSRLFPKSFRVREVARGFTLDQASASENACQKGPTKSRWTSTPVAHIWELAHVNAVSSGSDQSP
jgi:hypothetical protein